MTQRDKTKIGRRLTRRAFIASGAGLFGLAVLGLRGGRGSAGAPNDTQASLVQPGIVHRGGNAGCECPFCTRSNAGETAHV